jgi:RNA polymerase sigma factor (sigma-70 family)
MASDSAGVLLHRLRRAATRSQAGDVADSSLLERFLTSRDEIAFEQLVRAHGPMVLGVCRRLLGHEQDAEDAFQAAFLILSRKAGSIRRRGSLAGWLYAVACRTAMEARAMRSRLRRNEIRVEPLPDLATLQMPDSSDLRATLDHELGRLPAKYREAIVLCDLEGRSRAEAARWLDVPEGTLSSRLAAGRKKLADRLARRGIVLAAGALTVALSEAAASSVPPPLIAATVRGAVAWAAGPAAAGTVSTGVMTLTQGVLKTMFLTKLKFAAAAVLPLAALTAALIARAPADAPKKPASEGTSPAAAADAPKKPEARAEAKGAEKAVADAPPVVVKTVPQAGSDDVDPSLKEVRVTFSKEMTDQSWSWSTATEGDDLPDSGKPYYDKDKQTCVLPVKLEPGKTYAVWLNSEKFQNFKDAQGRSAVPYLLVFGTKKK